MGWDILFCYDGFLENSKPELPHTNLPFSRLSEKRKEVMGKGGRRLSSAADAKVLSPASLSYLYDRQRFPTGCPPDVRGLCCVAVSSDGFAGVGRWIYYPSVSGPFQRVILVHL